MGNIVYLRMKRLVNLLEYKHLSLKDIAYIEAPSEIKQSLENKHIYRMSKKDKNILVIDSFLIIKQIMEEYSDLDIQSVGPAQTIIQVTAKKKTNLLLAIVIWFILFVGTAMTIMNFHYDVSMQEVHQKLHYIITGEETEFPLWIQIPYSLGLGVGTLLFFNHWFKRRFNEEPSPLEVEIANYQADIEQYLITNENEIDERD